MQQPYLFEVETQCRNKAIWKHRYTIITPLAIINKNAMILKINIFDTQAQTFHNPQASPIHDLGHDFVLTVHFGNQGTRFIFR